MTDVAKNEDTSMDNFDAAFASLSALGDKPVPNDLSQLGVADEEPAEGNAQGEAPAEPAVAGAETPALEGEVPVDDAGAGDDGQKPAEESPKPAAPAAEAAKPDPVERLADLLTQRQQPQQEQQFQQQEQQVAHFTQEEAAFLQQYEQDFPDVARAEQLRRRADMRDLAQYIFQQMFSQIAPVRAVVEDLLTSQHLGELHQVAPDYDDVREKVIDWVKTQPPVLRKAYEQVISEGDVEDIKFLINTYKEATGQNTPAKPAAPAPTPTPKKETELPAAAKQAVASLAPVSSKRSAIVQSVSNDDFDGAFANWADKV